jgi:O-antigen biosynthesis protein
MTETSYDFELPPENDNNSVWMILRAIAPGSTVLEFGPAHGRMTRYLKEQLGCTVYAVEGNPEAAAEAARYTTDILTGDIEGNAWYNRYKNLKFDHLLFVDVLEHLHNPLEILKLACSLLTESGTVLISVPNIGHNAVLMHLWQNSFPYQQHGLLDRQHVHFFSRTSVLELVDQAGLVVLRDQATYLLPDNTELAPQTEKLPVALQELLMVRPYGDVYQWVLQAGKQACYGASVPVTPPTSLIPGPAQLFWENGNGFNEQDSLNLLVTPEGFQRLEFKLDDKIMHRFRLDPLNLAASITLQQVHVLTNDGRLLLLEPVSGNYDYREGSDYYFTDPDPQLYFEFPDKSEVVTTITVQLNYGTFGEYNVRQQLSRHRESVQVAVLEKKLDQAEQLAFDREKLLNVPGVARWVRLWQKIQAALGRG